MIYFDQYIGYLHRDIAVHKRAMQQPRTQGLISAEPPRPQVGKCSSWFLDLMIYCIQSARLRKFGIWLLNSVDPICNQFVARILKGEEPLGERHQRRRWDKFGEDFTEFCRLENVISILKTQTSHKILKTQHLVH